MLLVEGPRDPSPLQQPPPPSNRYVKENYRLINHNPAWRTFPLRIIRDSAIRKEACGYLRAKLNYGEFFGNDNWNGGFLRC
jgi:hypothetical protein